MSISPYQITLGLCCINDSLRKDGREWLLKSNEIKEKPRKKIEIFCSRTITRKNFTVEKAKELAIQNIKDLLLLLKWNEEHNIKHFRISSDMFPHFTDNKVEKYTIDFAKEELLKVAEYAKTHGHRLTFHPGQYNQIGAKNPDVFESTKADLIHHTNIFDMMGMDNSSILCIHGGGIYNNKKKTIKRWIKQFYELPENVRNRIALENCEKCYHTRDCLTIAEKCNIPVIFDTHHYNCYDILHPEEKQESVEDLLPEVVKSWTKTNRTPLFHISEQAIGKRIGTHSDYIDVIPEYLLKLSIGMKIDIEVEAKGKEKAIFELKKKYCRNF